MKPSGKADKIFFLVVVLIHALFYLLALHYQRFYNGDSFEYIQEAFNVKEYFFFYSGNPALPVTDEYKTLRTPGYPLFLLLVYSVTVSNKAVLLLQNMVSVFNIWYTRRILSDLGYNKKHDWIFLLLVAGFPSQFIYANTIAPDVLLQTFVLFYFRYAITFLQTRFISSVLKMSIALTVGLFIKPVLYPLAFIQCAVLLIIAVLRKLNVGRITIYAALPCIAVMVYSYWNLNRTGKFHFTSIQSFNAVYYHNNYVSATQGSKAAGDFLSNVRMQIESKPTFAARYDAAQKTGLRLLAQHPLSYLCFHFKKSILFFFETGRGELELFTGKTTLGALYANNTKSFAQIAKEESLFNLTRYILSEPIILIAFLVIIVNMAKMIGFVLLLLYNKMQRSIQWFIVLFVAYFALITGPISNAHYVLPVSLLLAGFAAIGFSVSLQQKKNSSIITM